MRKALGGITATFLMVMTLLAGCAAPSEDGAAAASASDASAPVSSQSDAQSNPSEADVHGDVTGEDEMDQSISTATITINGTSFAIELAGNDTASAFAAMLPMDVEMLELNGNEKYINLDESLPANANNPGTIVAGDVMLYGDNCLVVFYESHPTSYSYTRIGKIEDASGLASAVGSGSIEASFTAS